MNNIVISYLVTTQSLGKEELASLCVVRRVVPQLCERARECDT